MNAVAALPSSARAPSRRQALRLATLLALPSVRSAWAQPAPAVWNAAAFEARTPEDVYRALGLGLPVPSAEVSLQAPENAENGASVRIGFGTNLPGVRRLLLLVEKNPAALSAVFEPSDAVEPMFTTQVKLAQSSRVYAVAVLQDGRVLFAQKDVNVTLGSCA